MSTQQTIQPARRVKYVRLGNSGLKVSQIILGCMTYGSKEWRPWALDEEESIKHIKYAYEAGIQTFDTANMYSNGMGEIVLGNAIKKLGLPREEIVVMTKVRHPVGKTTEVSGLELFLAGPDNVGYVNQHGLSRKHIFDSVKASLGRLQMDYIDVLQCHRFDYATPVAETMQALHDVVQAGYVRYIGMSSCHAWQFHVMQNYAITHNLTPFISMQNQYSLLYREEEREMMPTLNHFGVGCIPWSPLARGALTRPYVAPTLNVAAGTTDTPSLGALTRLNANATSASDGENTKTTRQESDELPPEAYFLLGAGNKDVVDRVEQLAKKYNKTMAQIALAWHMTKDGVTAPIVGTTSLEKLEDLIGALDVKLSAEDVKYLEEPYKPMKPMMYV
ncbi:Aldo/keto reductase [Roridomyces roridus]|uniref:Aldo/keto reductase n=1 Tax=Roridomyces roridus TaxID=1738132 RepID=A0AAD7CDQ7_9AGAR|nr:Aldo/keto reductase [Roridomyces roridus]